MSIICIASLLVITLSGPPKIWANKPVAPIEPSKAHIRVSSEVDDLLKNVYKSESEKDWTNAVKNYQKALELYPQYVVNQSLWEKDKDSSLYWGVRYFCLNAIRNMPAEARKIYNETFSQLAKHLSDSACKIDPSTNSVWYLDIDKLAQITERYPFCKEAERALLILIDWYLEQADLYLAYRYYKQLIWLYPSYQNEITLPANTIINSLLVKPDETSKEGWFSYGGNNDRSKVMTVKGSGEQFSLCGYFDLPTDTMKLARPPLIDPLIRTGRKIEEPIPFFPVIKDGSLYLSGGNGIYVLSLPEDVSKEPMLLPLKWKFEIPLEENLQLFPEERAINTATVSDENERLYVPLITSFEKHERKLGFLTVKYPFPRRTLFAFNTRNGRILWDTAKDESLKHMLFPIAPLEEEQVLYVAGINMPNQTDVPEHYILAMNPQNAEVYFKTFVASGILETNLFNNPTREPIASAITVDSDNIYYCSQMGVIAAVDKHLGLLKWLKKYPQYYIPPTWPDYIPPRLPLRWINNPIIKISEPIYNRSAIIVTCIDSPFLYIISTENGEELWRWNADETELGNIRYILGLRDGLLVISGETAIVCLNLTKNGKIEWIITGHGISGKGAVCDNNKVYVPTNQAILEIGLKSGKLLNIHQLNKNTGHLLLADNLMVITSLNRLAIYRIKE